MQAECRVTCPYCWQLITLLVDTSVDNQDYVEDCHVCCRPISVFAECNAGEVVVVDARSQDEA